MMNAHVSGWMHMCAGGPTTVRVHAWRVVNTLRVYASRVYVQFQPASLCATATPLAFLRVGSTADEGGGERWDMKQE
jgi:hypothetical protein